MDNTTRALFVGHGTPMNAIEDNSFTETWSVLGRERTPKAIVAVSAHWYTDGTAVTAMEAPRTIHDFWGFPPELSAVQYQAPGSAEVAELVADVAKPTLVADDYDWGLDHGTWSVLKHMYPAADVPVVQLSLDAGLSFDEHFELGARLARLATEQDILIFGSGNVVHNLSAVKWDAGNVGFDWADRFDEAALDLMLTEPARAGSLVQHQDYAASVPTDEHFLPLAYVAGIAAELGGDVTAFNAQRTMGALSMTGYAVRA